MTITEFLNEVKSGNLGTIGVLVKVKPSSPPRSGGNYRPHLVVDVDINDEIFHGRVNLDEGKDPIPEANRLKPYVYQQVGVFVQLARMWEMGDRKGVTQPVTVVPLTDTKPASK